MSRTTNPVLTEHIVSAARRLWHQRGEKGLTLRAVARAAGTTTPSVYQRFPAKQDLIAAIADHIRLEIGSIVAASRDFENAFANYLQYARRHREEYVLLASSGLGQIIREDQTRPGLEWGRRELARRHGGRPDDYKRTVFAIASLLHGTVSFVLNMQPGAVSHELEESCRELIVALEAHPLELKRRRKKRR